MKDNIWNIILSTLATAILGILGYVLITLNIMQQDQAAQHAVDFNSKDAATLQRELTDIMTDIDMRIRLIERDVQWIKMISPDKIQSMEQPDPSPEPPRYKLDVQQSAR